MGPAPTIKSATGQGIIDWEMPEGHKTAPPQASWETEAWRRNRPAQVTQVKEQPVPDPRSLTPSPGHWPPPHKSRPDPRTATPNVGTVRILGLAGGGCGRWSPFLQIPKVTPTRWGWGGMLGQEPWFTGWDPWLIREKKCISASVQTHPFT